MSEQSPIPMILFCPQCYSQHIDAPSEQCEFTLGPSNDEPFVPAGESLQCQRAKGHEGEHLSGPDPNRFRWMNPPHKSHLCHYCGCRWRPADVETEGVEKIKTAGMLDTMFFNR